MAKRKITSIEPDDSYSEEQEEQEILSDILIEIVSWFDGYIPGSDDKCVAMGVASILERRGYIQKKIAYSKS